MKFSEIPASQIKAAEWNGFIQDSEEGAPFLLHAWLQASAPGWKCWQWSDQKGCVARMPLRIKQKIAWKAFRQPLFSMFWGICFRKNTDSDTRKAIYSQALTLLKQSVHWIDFCVSPRIEISDLPVLPGFNYDTKPTYRLQLVDGFEKNISPATQRQVRKAARSSFTSKRSTQHDVAISLLRLNPHIMSRKEQKLFLKVILDQPTADNPELWILQKEDATAVACGYFMFDADCCYYLAGAVHPDFRSSGAMSLLMFQVMEYAKSRGCSIFDFEGSSIPSVARFFEGFGAQRIAYLCIRANQLPLPIQWISKYI